MKTLMFGMSIQAFVTAILTDNSIINPSPFQQIMAGMIFLLVGFGLVWVSEMSREGGIKEL